MEYNKNINAKKDFVFKHSRYKNGFVFVLYIYCKYANILSSQTFNLGSLWYGLKKACKMYNFPRFYRKKIFAVKPDKEE